jgi:hypothetical protein
MEKETYMNDAKNNQGFARRLLAGLMTDWVWEVCLIVVATPVVVSTFLSIGTGFTS